MLSPAKQKLLTALEAIEAAEEGGGETIHLAVLYTVDHENHQTNGWVTEGLPFTWQQAGYLRHLADCMQRAQDARNAEDD